MFAIQCNFIIAFLVVFLKIDQSIYCDDLNNNFGRYKQRSAYTPESFGRRKMSFSTPWISPTARMWRDMVEKNQGITPLHPFRSLSRSYSIFESPTYTKRFQRIVSIDQYRNFTQQNDYVIIYFSSEYNVINCIKTNNALLNLKNNAKYRNIQIYEVVKEHNNFIASSYYVDSAPTLLLYRDGMCIKKEQGANVLTEIEIEKLFKMLLRIDDKAEDATEKASEDATEKASEDTTSNESDELTEPKRDGFLYTITSLDQYNKYSQGIDHSIIFFSSKANMNDKENSDAIKHILNTLSEKSVYKTIKIFNVDIKDCKGVADKFSIDSAPSLVSFCMENLIGTMTSNRFLEGRKNDDLIESFFTRLIKSEVRANWAKGPKRSGNIYNITSVEQYENYCQKTDYAIIFFTSPDEVYACEKVEKILNNFVGIPIYSKIKIYGVDVKNSNLSQYFKMETAPTLRSLCQNKLIYEIGPRHAQLDPFVGSLFSNLIASYTPDQVDTNKVSEASKKTVYNRSNLPPLEREDFLLKVKTKEDYDAYVINTELAVIDFSYKNCSGCDIANSILKKRMDEVQANQEIILYSVDIGKCNEVAQVYDTSSAPTLVFLHMGKQIEKFGAKESQTESNIQNTFDKLLKLKTPT